GESQCHLGSLAQAVQHPGTKCDTAIGWLLRLIGHWEDVRGLVAVSGNPQHPIGDGRPRLMCRFGSDDQAEMAGPDQVFVDLSVGRCTPDTPDRGRLADVVNLAYES